MTAMAARSIPPTFIVVIRTAGERTFEACKALILRQVPEDRLHVVDERPFEAALRRCYQIGIESDTEWMITVDADVLLRDGAINGLLAEAAAMPPDHFQVEGTVFDKLTNRARWAGLRCYRTAYLPAAASLLPNEGEQIRPESSTIHRFVDCGHPFQRSTTVYGVHDYDQYYRDVYRKVFVHASKHAHLLPELLRWWKTHAHMDADFRVALRAACDGLTASETPKADSRDYASLACNALTDLGFLDKPPLAINAIGSRDVDALLQAVRASGALDSTDTAASWTRLRTRYQRLGLLRLAPYLVGAFLSDLGVAMKGLAEKRSQIH